VRWPSHPFIQAVIRECGFPIAAPSANPFSRISPTTAEHVRHGLGNRIPLIVDGGPSQVGIESTVLDLSVTPPVLLRPGMISEQALASVLGKLRTGTNSTGTILKSPGQLPKHYAPQGKLLVLSWVDEADLKRQLEGLKVLKQWPFDLKESYLSIVIPNLKQY
jgi:L-threonylcarbamoyladenylate synthase